MPSAQAALALLRLLDSGICAQLPTHMLKPGGIPLPLCARNTGIYTGAALAFGVLRLRGRRRAMLPPAPIVIAALLGAIGVMGVDGLNSVAADLQLPHLYQPSNTLRLATGLAAGAALAVLLAPVIARARYGAADQRPPVSGLPDLAPLAVLLLGAFPLIWSSAAWTLYPVAIVSNAGLFAVLAGVNSIALDAWRGLRRRSTAISLERHTPFARLILLVLIELAVLATVRGAMLGPAVA